MQFAFASFRNELWRRRTKSYVHNENSEQIPKSLLTTFEALFMQNAKQIIVEKVAKTASKHQFRGGFVLGRQNRISLPSFSRYIIYRHAYISFQLVVIQITQLTPIVINNLNNINSIIPNKYRLKALKVVYGEI